LGLLKVLDISNKSQGAGTRGGRCAARRGMVDAAGERGELYPEKLQGRVSRAVFGYLDVGQPPGEGIEPQSD
jgi:hypothetical protein